MPDATEFSPDPNTEFIPPPFEFQGVKFVWTDDHGVDNYDPVDQPEEDTLFIYVNFEWVKLEPGTVVHPEAITFDGDIAQFEATVGLKEIEGEHNIFENLLGKANAQTPQEALTLALADFARLFEYKVQELAKYAETISARALSTSWVVIEDPPILDEKPDPWPPTEIPVK